MFIYTVVTFPPTINKYWVIVKRSDPTVMSVSEPLFLCRRKTTSIVRYWNFLYVIGSSLKLLNHFIISHHLRWDNNYYYCILRSIIIWENLKVVVYTKGQPSTSYIIIHKLNHLRHVPKLLELKDYLIIGWY